VKLLVCLSVLVAFPALAAAADGGAPSEATPGAGTPDAAAPDAGAPDAAAPPPAVEAAAPGPAPSAAPRSSSADGEMPNAAPQVAAVEPSPSPPPKINEPFPPPTQPPPDEWPIESVLRPQTIPGGRTVVTLTSSGSVVDSAFRDRYGRQYGSYAQLGVSFGFGVTHRIELDTFFPRIFCFATGELSQCSGYARFNGSGFGLAFGLVRTRPFQLVATSSLAIAVTTPLAGSVDLGVGAKVLLGDRVALDLSLGASKLLGAPLGYPNTAYASEGGQIDIQASHNLLVWGGLRAYSAINFINEPRLTPSAGLSWTFENATQVGASGGVWNILPRESWDIGLPVTSFGVYLLTWI
jgi:hypothetical protein